MYTDTFDMADKISQGAQRYDTWVRADQFKHSEQDECSVHINGHTYIWLPADRRSILPNQYIELTLQKI
jgi:hypothetical protein